MPTDIHEEDIIWIQEAAKLYGRNRKTLDDLIAERKLSVVAKTGDRKTYLIRAELEALFRPHIVQPADTQQAG